VLLTGATGFVGSFIAEDLISMGYEVFATIRKNSDLSWIHHLDLNKIYLDLNSPSAIQKILEDNKISLIVHNAGLTRHSDESELNKVNAEILKNFVTAIDQLSFKIDKLIFISSLAAYGSAEHKPNHIVERESKPQPLTAYGRSKLLAESNLQGQNIPYLILRPTAVYGPREKDLLTLYKTLNKGFDISIASGQKLSFIYVKDLSEIIVKSLEFDLKQKEYFVSDGELYDSKYFSELISNNLGKRPIKISLPKIIIKFVCQINDILGKLFGFHPLLNSDKYNEIAAKSWNCYSKDLWDELNLKPRYLLKDGVKEAVEWYKLNKWL
jgi:nucleoside-diphosphate-sugar epimerase